MVLSMAASKMMEEDVEKLKNAYIRTSLKGGKENRKKDKQSEGNCEALKHRDLFALLMAWIIFEQRLYY